MLQKAQVIYTTCICCKVAFGNLTYRVDMISRWRIHLQWARLHHGHFHSEFVDVMHTLSCVGSIAHAGRLMGSPESTVKVVKI